MASDVLLNLTRWHHRGLALNQRQFGLQGPNDPITGNAGRWAGVFVMSVRVSIEWHVAQKEVPLR